MAYKKYIEKYPGCTGCPHIKYCGTMVGSVRLCNSYTEDEPQTETDDEDEYIPEDLIGDYTDATGLEV